jgi:endonuclease/exonuclease/phosphatase family metal-dependent hydrolase
MRLRLLVALTVLLEAPACGGGPNLNPGGGAAGSSSGGSGGGTQEAATPLPVRVVNWNVRNFFNDKVDSPEIQGETVLSTADYDKKLGQVTSVLSRLDPDIAVLEEIENENVTDAIAKKLGGYPNRATTLGNDPRGIDIAILSRFPIDKIVSHKGEFFSPSTDPTRTFIYARDVMEVHLTINGRHVVLMGVHFKAKGDATSQVKRLAEAEHTRKIALQMGYNDSSAAVIVLGDFNCTPDSAPMKALVGAPPAQYATVGDLIPAAQRYSTIYSGQHELIDNQVMNDQAQSLIDSAYPASVSIFRNATVSATSDHDPVVATYDVN